MQFGLLGRKLGHSYSPMIHELIGHYSYNLFEREPDQISDLLSDPSIQGLNVTIPYKREVLPFLDTVDELARKLGNVNTVVRNQDGTLSGYNTDYNGFFSLIKHSGLSVAGKKVLVLGSGGAAATVCAVISDLGGNYITISRHGENNYQNVELHQDARFIVNATPVGMYPDTGIAPLSLAIFPELEGVFDLIYNPAKTQLLLEAENLGIPGYNGLWMLVAQAKKAAELFTGNTYGDDLVEKVFHILENQMKNIVLIGMPGCGKTTVGKLLEEKLGRTMVDLDEEISKQAGKSIPEIFAEDGESSFRSLETKIIGQYGNHSGLILSTGGGCVTQTVNYPLLHQNGSIFWIQRDLHALNTDGRPLSQQNRLEDLYKARAPMYRQFADFTVYNRISAEQCAEDIVKKLEEMP